MGENARNEHTDLEDFPELPSSLGDIEDFPGVPETDEELEDFPDEAGADDELEDFPDDLGEVAPAAAPARRSLRGRNGPSRRAKIIAGLGALAVAGGTWFALGAPGLPEREATPQPNITPADPDMDATEVPYSDVADPEPAQDARAGDVLYAEPSELPEGLTARQQVDGTWIVLEDVPADQQDANSAENVTSAVKEAIGDGKFSPERMTDLMGALERQDAQHYATTGTQLLVTYTFNGKVNAWAAVRGEDGMVAAVFTAVGDDPAAAEAELRKLAADTGADLGERFVVNAG